MNLILIHTQESCKLWCIIYVYTHTYESYFDTRLGITQIVIEELPLVLAEIRGVDKEVDILKSQHAIQCVAVCCSVLQCVAVCCSVLQCVAARYSIFYMLWLSVLQCVAVCCSVLQHAIQFSICCDYIFLRTLILEKFHQAVDAEIATVFCSLMKILKNWLFCHFV